MRLEGRRHLLGIADLTRSDAERILDTGRALERKVYDVPTEIDDEIARLKLATMGVAIDELTEEQATYLASWDEGT